MKSRKLGAFEVGEIGLGCMNLSHAYGYPPSAGASLELIAKAIDLGVTHFDTAAVYGFGRNEELVGPALKAHRDNIVLASKGGMRGENGVRTISGSPAALRHDLDASLKRLQTDRIDLYYLHRLDNQTPVEDSVGEMSRFVEAGKVRAIGLSEVSAITIRKAHAVHPIAAVQSEYSLWTRNVELAVLDTCQDLGIAFVAFSPLARGFLTGTDLLPQSFAEKDIRRGMPRFQEPNWSKNAELLAHYRGVAAAAGCSPAQLALSWLLDRSENMHVIPGTTSLAHLKDNLHRRKMALGPEIEAQLQRLINQHTVSGSRYPASTQADIDTEDFDPLPTNRESQRDQQQSRA